MALTEYERERQQRIEANKRKFAEMGLQSALEDVAQEAREQQQARWVRGCAA